MTTFASAQLALTLLLAQAQPALPPPEEEPHQAGRADRETGLTALAAGYLMGAFIVIGPPLFTKNGRSPVQNGGEKRLGLIPLVGPMMWWARARLRLDAQGCSHCFVDLDSGFHNVLALPYAILATGAQAVGVGLLTYGILESHEAVASRAAPPVAKLQVTPTPGGLSLQGTF